MRVPAPVVTDCVGGRSEVFGCDCGGAFLSELDQRGRLEWQESVLDGSFASAKKGRRRRQNQAGQGHKVDGGGTTAKVCL